LAAVNQQRCDGYQIIELVAAFFTCVLFQTLAVVIRYHLIAKPRMQRETTKHNTDVLSHSFVFAARLTL